MSLSEFEEEAQNPLVLTVDTRLPYAFAGSHIPNSLSIWLGGTSVYPGWLMDTKQYIVFVHERPTDIDTVAPRLGRLGFDNMCGYLCGGMNQWQEEGKPYNSYGTTPVFELKDKLAKGIVRLLDVREANEWREDNVVEGAELIHFPDLPEKADSLLKDKPWVVTCSVGNRASIACSILERAGFKNLSNALGGMTAWYNLGYPTKSV
jgi:hydroxyacylglutathione hydrolase